LPGRRVCREQRGYPADECYIVGCLFRLRNHPVNNHFHRSKDHQSYPGIVVKRHLSRMHGTVSDSTAESSSLRRAPEPGRTGPWGRGAARGSTGHAGDGGRGWTSGRRGEQNGPARNLAHTSRSKSVRSAPGGRAGNLVSTVKRNGPRELAIWRLQSTERRTYSGNPSDRKSLTDLPKVDGFCRACAFVRPDSPVLGGAPRRQEVLGE
jgi:hypothetical protein